MKRLIIIVFILSCFSEVSYAHSLGWIKPAWTLDRYKSKTMKTKCLKLYPSRYDLRDLGVVTPIKNQNHYGTCWAFATFGALESDLLFQEGIEKDFSEDHLANYHGWDYCYSYGGNALMSVAYLSRGQGPVLDECDPYPNPGDGNPYCPRDRYIEQAIFIPGITGPQDMGILKNAIQKYGALYTTMLWDNQSYNPDTHTYYYSGSISANHAVTLIGWDDNFEVPGAPDKGAWIVKNSWGANWGENGYFYVSYYDTCFAHLWSVAYKDTGDLNSGLFEIYQGDLYGPAQFMIHPVAVSHVATDPGYITSIGIWMKLVNNDPTPITIKLYLDCDDPNDCGDPVSERSDFVNDSGYKVFRLPLPTYIDKGEDFVVEVDGPEVGTEVDNAGYHCSMNVPSWVYYNGEWGLIKDVFHTQQFCDLSIKVLQIPDGIMRINFQSNSQEFAGGDYEHNHLELIATKPSGFSIPSTIYIKLTQPAYPNGTITYYFVEDKNGVVLPNGIYFNSVYVTTTKTPFCENCTLPRILSLYGAGAPILNDGWIPPTDFQMADGTPSCQALPDGNYTFEIDMFVNGDKVATGDYVINLNRGCWNE